MLWLDSAIRVRNRFSLWDEENLYFEAADDGTVVEFYEYEPAGFGHRCSIRLGCW